MTPREAGFLLLTSQLGNPERKVLTAAQLRELTRRMAAIQRLTEDRDLELRDLMILGYNREMAMRILGLLEERELLEYYVNRGKKTGCIPITRVSSGYPAALRIRLGGEAPGVLWARGDLSVLDTPGIALVGSRDLNPENRRFAEEAGRQAANQGLTLISGNARGADVTAQNACLRAGGKVISIVADSLVSHSIRDNVLYLSEDGFDEEFSAQRALSRNRCIHTMGALVLVAQANLQKGGTWDGTSRNLRFGWNRVCCFNDGSDVAQVLEQMGAELIAMEELSDFGALLAKEQNLFDQ